jgi:hypothetical protein
LLYQSVNIDGNIPKVYTEGITVRKERIDKEAQRYDDMSLLHTELSTS